MDETDWDTSDPDNDSDKKFYDCNYVWPPNIKKDQLKGLHEPSPSHLPSLFLLQQSRFWSYLHTINQFQPRNIITLFISLIFNNVKLDPWVSFAIRFWRRIWMKFKDKLQ